MRFLRKLRHPRSVVLEVYRLLWLEFNRGQRLLLSVFACCVVMVFGILGMARIPFEPFAVYRYQRGAGCGLSI